MSAVAAAAPTTTGVVSSRPLWAEAVACVLEGASLEVLRGHMAAKADALVLVEPADDEWELVRASGRPAVVLLSVEPEGDQLVELVEAGAHAVLTKTCEPDQLVRTIVSVAAGSTGLTGGQVRRLSEALQARGLRDPMDALSVTKREREILVGIETGLSVKQTARLLEISPRTVENTQRLLFRKLGVRNRSQAVARALEAGLLGSRPGGESS